MNESKPTNETYEITVSSPLLRPGLSITTKVSSKYVVQTALSLIEKVREINRTTNDTARTS